MIGLDTSGVKSGWQIWAPRPALGKVYAGRGVGDPALSRNLSININGSSRIPSLEALVSRSLLHNERGKMAVLRTRAVSEPWCVFEAGCFHTVLRSH